MQVEESSLGNKKKIVTSTQGENKEVLKISSKVEEFGRNLEIMVQGIKEKLNAQDDEID